VELLQHALSSCLRVAGEVWEMAIRVSAADKEKDGTPVVGATAAFFDNNGFALASGRFFTEGEAASGADIAVLGADVVDVLYPGRNPLGLDVRVRNKNYRMSEPSSGAARRSTARSTTSWRCRCPTFLIAFGHEAVACNVTVMARDPEHPGLSRGRGASILRKARGVAPEAENDFDIFRNRSIQERFDESRAPSPRPSIGICAISLSSAASGVMNIMLVAP
jgi:putative ABC transport system permease protein